MNRRRKILIAVGVIIGVAVLVPVIRHYQLKAAVNRYRAELKAKGEPMELAQVIPPPVPAEQNNAVLLTNAIALLNTNQTVLDTNPPPAMRMVVPGKALIAWMQPDVRDSGEFGATNTWAEVDAALAKEKPAMDLLHQLPEEPLFDFNLNYGDGFSKIKFGQLAPTKKAAQRLVTSAISNLRHGDAKTATKDLQAILLLVNGLSHDRLLISELVRIAIAQIVMTSTWEYLQSTNVTEKQLAMIQSRWTDLEFVQAFENSMNIERTVGIIELSKMRATNLKIIFDAWNALGADSGGNVFSGLRVKYKTTAWRYWWSYPDELRYLRVIGAVMEGTRQTKTNYSFFTADSKLKERIEALGIEPNQESAWFIEPEKADFHFIMSSSAMSYEKGFKKVEKVEAARQLAVTAIALKRFQLKHGSYPETLSELTPEFLATVPRDPVDSQPLRYRRNADGTSLLYSIGEDGEDDGGNPQRSGDSKSRSWQNGRDWVWPQPASAKEIQAYYELEAKKSKN